MDRPDGEGGSKGLGRTWIPTLALVGALIVWLWPIGLGGAMPVGGDVTQFSIGLMAVLGRAIRAWRLPLWNDLWGYGFPGLAESQMGAYYPSHLVLYGFLPTEAAYTTSLVVHTLWAGLGAAWASRRFEVSAWGSALAGFAWATSGFYLIHLPHQWGYTVGSWMPWAWGLGWSMLRGTGGVAAAPLLAAVLAIQVLPGHFQLAFNTQVGLLALGLWTLVDPPEGGRRVAIRRLGVLVAAMAALIPLAALQLWPTFRLAWISGGRRDFEYLSGFAATPIHLVSYLAPGLFHRSPLWRPLAWDPFHTSPEEHLAYVGLAPLFLALGAIVHTRGRDRSTRALATLALLTLILSLGPYLPGFTIWSRWPGFSFFRAPARWGLATGLALAILAGKGLDTLPAWPRPGRSLARFVGLAVAAPLLVVLGVELALASTAGPGWPAAAAGFERALRALPWSDDPPFVEILEAARRPQDDLRVYTGLARAGIDPGRAEARTFERSRVGIYAAEWSETAALLVLLLALAPFLARRRVARPGLLVLTLVDLLMLGRQRPVDLGPIRPLDAQSRVLGALADLPRGTRSIDPMRNLPMVAGVAPVLAYRTLDLPALTGLTSMARAPIIEPIAGASLRAVGAGVRVFDGVERPATSGPDLLTLRDPVLAGWLFGPAWVATGSGSRASDFTIWQPDTEPVRAWFVAEGPGRSLADLAASRGDPAEVLTALQTATPLPSRSDVPERLEVGARVSGPGCVVISVLSDPEWAGTWIGPDGLARPAELVRVFGGWQAARPPEPGDWTLRLEYRGRAARVGLWVSGLAWSVGLLACWSRHRRSKRSSDLAVRGG